MSDSQAAEHEDVRAQLVAEIEVALAGGPAVAVATVIDPGEQGGLRLGAKLLVRAGGLDARRPRSSRDR